MYGFVSVPLPGFSGLRPINVYRLVQSKRDRVSVPLPGFSGLRLCKLASIVLFTVSVPLPGFSGLRPPVMLYFLLRYY